MKTADYKLNGDIPRHLLGTFATVKAEDGTESEVRTPFSVKTREAETDEDMLALVEDGDAKHVRKLAQGQLDIIVQRNIRNYANSDEVLEALYGTKEPAADAEPVEGGVEAALELIQKFADEYLYGVTRTSSGAGAGTKAKAKQADAVAAAAKNDPELAAKLAALGITF